MTWRTLCCAVAIVAVSQPVLARSLTLPPTRWEGTVLGHARHCRGQQVLAGIANSVDGGRLRCGGRILTFETHVVNTAGTLETTGRLCRPGQPLRRCCPLTFVVITGDFFPTPGVGSAVGSFLPISGTVQTLSAGASCPRRIYPPGSIQLRRVE